MPKKILVKDIMSKRVFSCNQNTTVDKAAITMRENDIGCMIIIEGKKPIGMVTREDITNKVAAENKKPSDVKVKDVMTAPLVTCSQDDDISEVAKLMNKYGYRRLPVKYMDKLIGFLTVKDLLRVSPGLLDLFEEHLEKEETDNEGTANKDEVTAGDCELCGNYSETLKNINDKWVCENCEDEAEEL